MGNVPSVSNFVDINTIIPYKAENITSKKSCYNYSHLIKMDQSNKNILVNDDLTNFLPVLTLSTNTDSGRDLTRDSFALIQFKNTSNDLTDICVDSDSPNEKKIQINNILLKLVKESSLINNFNKQDKSEYFRLIDLFKRNTGITGGSNIFNIQIYEFILKGYPSKGIFNIKTEAISSSDENSCNYIDLDKTPITNPKDYIRSCDPINGKLIDSTTPISLAPSNDSSYDFTMTIFGNRITSEDLIKFTNIYPTKTNVRSVIDMNPLTSTIPSLKCIYDNNDINQILTESKKILLRIWNLNKIPPLYQDSYIKDKTLIQKINNTSIEDKFIIMGDFHGSLATFVRLLLRFRKMGILNNECILQNNYHLIFLGDIVDRGVYGYEIIMLLYCLLILNPDKVHINRGNHEESKTNSQYGLYKEITTQFSNGYDIYTSINTVMEYQSSAILIKDPNDNKYIYLSHGSLPAVPDSGKFKLLDSFTDFDNNLQLIIPNIEFPGETHQIRWNDVDNNKTSVFGTRGGHDVMIGEDIIREAQKRNIKISVRGHNDTNYNTKLLKLL